VPGPCVGLARTVLIFFALRWADPGQAAIILRALYDPDASVCEAAVRALDALPDPLVAGLPDVERILKSLPSPDGRAWMAVRLA